MGGFDVGQSGPARTTGGTGDPWHVVVLAAGRGTRMGGPKALMRVGGRVWWEVQEERLVAAGLARTWVVSERVALEMKACASPLVMGDPDAPMFESVRTGIAASPPGRGVFVLPVDVPAAGAGTFGLLARAAAVRVAVPVYRGKRGHPVALSRGWIDRVFTAAIARGGALRLDELIGPDAVEVAVDDPEVAVNLNTPEDIARWIRG